MRVVILLCGVLSVAYALNVCAQDDAVFDQAPGETVSKGSSDVRELLDAYLREQGWVEGPNLHNGQTIYVATGIGVIQAPATSPDFVKSRVYAFDVAMIKARQTMTEYIGSKIETEAALAYSAGNLKRLDALGAIDSGTPSILDKICTLIHATLDEEIQKRPGGNNNADKQKVLQEAVASTEYMRLTRSIANATVVGLQAYKVIEITPAGGNAQIGVVAVYSPKLARMAYALASGTAIAPTTPSKPLIEQVPSDPAQLITNFGVSQRIDENGDYALVVFGHARPRTQSTQSKLMAEREARAQAMSALRSFAGENVTAVWDLLEAETVKEYENQSASYKDESAYREVVRTRADALNITGVELLRRWSATHPATGGDIVGVALVWSPARHAKAQTFREGMRRDVDRSVNQPSTINATDGAIIRQGFDGDPDAL